MMRAQAMSVAPSGKRRELGRECGAILERLRDLNREHFGDAEFVRDALNEAEGALQILAEAGDGRIVEDHSDGAGNCAVCGAAISRFEVGFGEFSRAIVLCEPCAQPFMRVKAKLESPTGFGTCFI